jgi:hypothetical protein
MGGGGGLEGDARMVNDPNPPENKDARPISDCNASRG